MTRTYSPKLADVNHDWYVVDAAGQTLGRLSAAVARVLQGKHKPDYAAHLDSGDFVIVLNADQAVLTGRKEEEKVYYRQSGRPGGLKRETARELRSRRPIALVETAVRGMLPKTKHGPQAVQEAQGLRAAASTRTRRRSRSRCRLPRCAASGEESIERARATTAPGGARPRRRASSCARAAAR